MLLLFFVQLDTSAVIAFIAYPFFVFFICCIIQYSISCAFHTEYTFASEGIVRTVSKS